MRTGLIAALLLACSCAFDAAPTFLVSLPDIPGPWLDALGPPSWSLRWFAADGSPRRAEAVSGDDFSIEVLQFCASPVLAYPYWPDSGIEPGRARPAGGVVPFDQRGTRIVLSWRGGVAASFYLELLGAAGPEDTHPRFFDWPRFGDLLESDRIDPEASADPWTVDWRLAAARTRASGFDMRRVSARPFAAIKAAAPNGGPWASTSPFAAAPLPAEAGAFVLRAYEEPDSLLSAAGELRFSAEACAWFPRALLDKLPVVR